MAGTLAQQTLDRLDQAERLYNRLILVVGPSGAGKTAALRQVSEARSFPLVNLNLELSQRLLELSEKQRSLRCGQIVGEIVDQAGGPVVLLDNLEIVFDPALRQDPLRLLQRISRNRTIVATWNGLIAEDNLIYAEAGHPEYRRYPVQGLLIVTA